MKITPSINGNNINNTARINKTSYTSSSPSFQGKKGDGGLIARGLNKAFGLDEIIAEATAKLSQTKISEKIIGGFRKFKNPGARMCDFESFIVTFFYALRTWKDEKIEKARKIPSIIQNIAVSLVASTSALLLDTSFDPFIENLTKAYEKLPKDITKKFGGWSSKQFYDAAKSLKTNTVFTAVVRFIVPVLMVPVVGKIVEKLKEKNGAGKEADTAQTEQTQEIQSKQTTELMASKLNTTQGYAPILNFDEHNKENKFKSLYA